METPERPCERRRFARGTWRVGSILEKSANLSQSILQLSNNYMPIPVCAWTYKCRLGDTNRGWTQRRPFWNLNITKVERPLSIRKNMVSNILELKSERDFHGKIS